MTGIEPSLAEPINTRLIRPSRMSFSLILKTGYRISAPMDECLVLYVLTLCSVLQSAGVSLCECEQADIVDLCATVTKICRIPFQPRYTHSLLPRDIRVLVAVTHPVGSCAGPCD